MYFFFTFNIHQMLQCKHTHILNSLSIIILKQFQYICVFICYPLNYMQKIFNTHKIPSMYMYTFKTKKNFQLSLTSSPNLCIYINIYLVDNLLII